MRVVIDGVPIKGSNSLSIIIEGLIGGWVRLDSGDELHLVVTPQAEIDIPDSVQVHRVPLGRGGLANRLRTQNVDVPRLCRAIGADAMLGVIPATTMAPLPCPRAVILYDLRHEVRPDQFSRLQRALRVSWSIGFRQADAVVCISERTRQDLLRTRPWLDPAKVGLGYLAGDQADSWPRPDRPADPPYAVAFGHFVNKNVPMLLEGWALLRDRGEAPPLQLFGIPSGYRSAVEEQIASLDLGSLVTPLPWLPDAEMHERFAGASLLVFPSDFEGFGMPPVEAMRLSIPVVVSPEPALVEITAGHATVMAGWTAADLAAAVQVAWSATPEQLAAAKDWAGRYTWSNMAVGVRERLQYAISHH